METEDEYKQCPRGHYYQGDHCPYCKSTRVDVHATEGVNDGSKGEKTAFFSPNDRGMGNPGRNKGIKTEIFNPTGSPDETDGTMRYPYGNSVKGDPTTNNNGMKSTFIIDDEPLGTVPGSESNPPITPRPNGRRLVGWLVTYSLDPCGVDFKLYEGRNFIGQDMDCNVTINDPMVSGRHAILLFRAGRFSITDNQSTNGTFINDEDIELEPHYLKDGDVIRIGKTVLKFKTAF